MTRPEVEELKKMGAMPDECNDDISDEIIDRYSELVEAISKPITFEEGNILIELFPEFSLYGTEWELLHLIESLYGKIKNESYKELIEKCNSQEWKDTLIKRYENANG